MRWLSKLLGKPKRKDNPPEGTVMYFHYQVEDCMEGFHATITRLRRRYPDTALAAALGMHTVAALSVCVRDSHMTRDEARHMLRRIAELEFDVATKRQ